MTLGMQASSSPTHRVEQQGQTQEHETGSSGVPTTKPVPPPSVVPSVQGSQCCQDQADTIKSGAKNQPNIWSRAFSPETWSNWALVFVGLVASFIGVVTLIFICGQTKAIQKQALTMIKQTRVLQRQARAAEDNVIASKDSIKTLVAKDRARISITPIDLTVEGGPLAIHMATYRLTCYGATFAIIEDAWAAAQITESKVPPGDPPHVPMSLDAFITPDPKGLDKTAIVFNTPSGEVHDRITSGKLFVHFAGEIIFKDFSGEIHSTKFRYVWHVTGYTGANGKILAFWMKMGEEENSET